MAEDRVLPQSLRWGLNHLGRFGLSDFVPRAFELDAMQNGAAELLGSSVWSADLGAKKLRPFRQMLVPRPTGGYRLSTELDPLDGLTFAAIAHELAPAVEAASVRRERAGSMSGRVRITAEGDLFSSESWPAFAARTMQFSREYPQYQYIVFTDISDFYGQVSFETVRKKLGAAGVPEVRAHSIIGLLSQSCRRAGRGLPQGPTLSRLIAELILADVDKFLARDFVPFLRYADDFRIFAQSSGEAERLLYRLTQMLFDEFGFTLSAPKTQIVAAAMSRGFPVTPEETAPGQENVEHVIPLDLDPLPIQAARTALADGKLSHPPALTDSVFRNLPRLTPIMRDVVDYLATDLAPQVAEWQRDAVRSFAESASLDVPFIRWVMVSLLLARDLLPRETVFQLALEGRESLGLRPALEAAHYLGQKDWLAAQQGEYAALNSWDRRGLLYWGRSLDGEARAKLLAQAAEAKDPLDEAVMRWAEVKAKQDPVYTAMSANY